jgi:hypothetical protein
METGSHKLTRQAGQVARLNRDEIFRLCLSNIDHVADEQNMLPGQDRTKSSWTTRSERAEVAASKRCAALRAFPS